MVYDPVSGSKGGVNVPEPGVKVRLDKSAFEERYSSSPSGEQAVHSKAAAAKKKQKACSLTLIDCQTNPHSALHFERKLFMNGSLSADYRELSEKIQKSPSLTMVRKARMYHVKKILTTPARRIEIVNSLSPSAP
jgi:hypothetical protein